MRRAKTLIRLGGCPDWSESSLVAHSFCWFCHVAAHFFFFFFFLPRSSVCLAVLKSCPLLTWKTFKIFSCKYQATLDDMRIVKTITLGSICFELIPSELCKWQFFFSSPVRSTRRAIAVTPVVRVRVRGRGRVLVTLWQSFICKFFKSSYLDSYSSESVHIWTIGTLEGRLSFHDSWPQRWCPGMGPEVKI